MADNEATSLELQTDLPIVPTQPKQLRVAMVPGANPADPRIGSALVLTPEPEPPAIPDSMPPAPDDGKQYAATGKQWSEIATGDDDLYSRLSDNRNVAMFWYPRHGNEIVKATGYSLSATPQIKNPAVSGVGDVFGLVWPGTQLTTVGMKNKSLIVGPNGVTTISSIAIFELIQNPYRGQTKCFYSGSASGDVIGFQITSGNPFGYELKISVLGGNFGITGSSLFIHPGRNVLESELVVTSSSATVKIWINGTLVKTQAITKKDLNTQQGYGVNCSADANGSPVFYAAFNNSDADLRQAVIDKFNTENPIAP